MENQVNNMMEEVQEAAARSGMSNGMAMVIGGVATLLIIGGVKMTKKIIDNRKAQKSEIVADEDPSDYDEGCN